MDDRSASQQASGTISMASSGTEGRPPDPMVSYAQNLEDVLLHRALADVGRGFYVDVGAQDPVDDSVTKAFYERGWRGINVEPVRHWFERLVADRPEDINLECALGAEEGRLVLYDVPESGLSTTVPEIAEKHRRDGYEVVERETAVVTLDAVFARHGVTTVHFLKIDVEGAEAAVLRGVSLSTVRPWIIVVEATAPNSRTLTHHEWEDLVTSRGYGFVWFDGLNRFYVADEHAELKAAFTSQPNIFDRYFPHKMMEALTHAASTEAALKEAGARSEALKARLDEAGARSEALQARLDEQGDAARRLEAEAKTLRSRIASLERSLEREEALGTELTKRFERTVAGLRQEAATSQSQAEQWRRIVEEQRALMDRWDAMQSSARASPDAGRNDHMEATIRQLEGQIAAMRSSTSWRLTAPVRGVKLVYLALLGPGAPDRTAGTGVGERLRRLALRAAEQPRLRKLAVSVLARHPALKHRILDVLLKPPPSPPASWQEPQMAAVLPAASTIPALPTLEEDASAGRQEVWKAFDRARTAPKRP